MSRTKRGPKFETRLKTALENRSMRLLRELCAALTADRRTGIDYTAWLKQREDELDNPVRVDPKRRRKT